MFLIFKFKFIDPKKTEFKFIDFAKIQVIDFAKVEFKFKFINNSSVDSNSKIKTQIQFYTCDMKAKKLIIDDDDFW